MHERIKYLLHGFLSVLLLFTAATSLNDLAALYQAQGRYPEAEPLYQHAVMIVLISLGIEHPQTQQNGCHLSSKLNVGFWVL